MDVANPERLPPITRGKLQLDDPVCRAWVETMMVRLARTMPPERALAWWMRLHIGLNNKAPAYMLPEGWTPACAEACLLEVYLLRSMELAGHFNPLTE